MATRFNFRSSIQAGTTDDSPGAEQSTVLPIGTNAGGIVDKLRMTEDVTNSTVTQQLLTLPQTARQSGYFGIFTSDRLAAQTIPAQTWSAVIRRRESSTAVNAFLAASIYVWRPSTSSVVGFIYNSSTSLGAEFPTTFGTATYNLTGSAVTCQQGDVLVMEPWWSAAQGMATEYTVEIQYENTAYSYLESPQTLSFYIPPRERSFAHIIY